MRQRRRVAYEKVSFWAFGLSPSSSSNMPLSPCRLTARLTRKLPARLSFACLVYRVGPGRRQVLNPLENSRTDSDIRAPFDIRERKTGDGDGARPAGQLRRRRQTVSRQPRAGVTNECRQNTETTCYRRQAIVFRSHATLSFPSLHHYFVRRSQKQSSLFYICMPPPPTVGGRRHDVIRCSAGRPLTPILRDAISLYSVEGF